MEKFNHIAYMFNERTKGKKYENYVVNAIYTKINNPELIPVTQQCVRNVKDKRNYYLLDLYFPQLNYGIEVDEGQHETSEHQLKDRERAENILSAIECEEGRIKLYQNDGKTLRSFEDITEQIDREVEKIKAMMEGRKIIWRDNEEEKNEVFKRGFFDINDDVVYKNFTEIYNRIFNRDAPTYNTIFKRLKNTNYYLWVPPLTIKMDDVIVKSSDNWENFLNEDHNIIIEKDVANEKNLKDGCSSECYKHLPSTEQLEYKLNRIVFLNMKDRFNNNVVKFIGEFKFTHAEIVSGSCIRYYERVKTKIYISDLKGGFINESSVNNEKKTNTDLKRDYTQYKVNGMFAGGKGKTVYKVVKLYVDSHSDLSFGDLQAIFSDSKIKVGTKQIIRKWEEVKDWRRFSKQPLVLHDGQKVAISNQWGVNKNQGGKGANWAYFLDLARDLGIEVEPIS